MSGTAAFTARQISRYVAPVYDGWMPPCMQTSVAPRSQASSVRLLDLLERQVVGLAAQVLGGLAFRERAELAAVAEQMFV